MELSSDTEYLVPLSHKCPPTCIAWSDNIEVNIMKLHHCLVFSSKKGHWKVFKKKIFGIFVTKMKFLVIDRICVEPNLFKKEKRNSNNKKSDKIFGQIHSYIYVKFEETRGDVIYPLLTIPHNIIISISSVKMRRWIYLSLSQMKLKIYLIELVKSCHKGVDKNYEILIMCWICLTNDNRILYLNKMELQKMRGKTFKRNRQYYWPWTKTWIIFETIMLLFKLNVGFSNILKTSKQNLNSVDKSK